MSRQDLEYVAGNTVILPLTFLNDGVIIDISLWTVQLTLKINPDSNDSEASIKVDADMTEGASGVALFVLSHIQTKPLLGHYWYDIKYKNASKQVETVLYGKFVFRKPINIELGDVVSSPSSSPSSSVSASPSVSSSPSLSPSSSPSESSSPSLSPSSSP